MIRTLHEWWNDTSDLVIIFLITLIVCVPLTVLATNCNDPSQPYLPTGVQVADEIASLVPPMSSDITRTGGLRPLQDPAVG